MWIKSIMIVCYFIVLMWILFLVMCIFILMVNEIEMSCGKIYCKFFLDKIFWLGLLVMYYKFNLIGMYVIFFGVMVVLYLVMFLILKR